MAKTGAVLLGLWPVLMGSARGDIIHADDVIIQQSLGVGQDAVNGENFGFDTIRMKENNLRMHFDDTSASASFPGNDWRFIFNDSTNGGGNYFALEDSTAGRQSFRVDAGAPANALRVDAQGDVGIGTASPVVGLHHVDGNTPTLRLEQDGSSGFTAQTWDLASNETNFFIRDTTGGSDLVLRLKTGAPANSLFVDTDGDVGLGSESPDAALHVVTAAGDKGLLIGPDSGFADSPATLHVEGTGFFTQTLEVGSSRERKEKIRDLTREEALLALGGLEPVQFHYKNDPAAQLGFIAEDVPDIVATSNRKSVRPMDFVALLTKVVQGHEEREQELIKALDDQKRQIAELSARLEAVEAQAGLPDEIP